MAIKEYNTNHLIDIDGSYIIKTLNGEDVSSKELSIDFSKEKQNVSGFSGCNRFTGNYVLNKGLITIGPLASTRKLCQENANKLEQELLKALANVEEITIKQNELHLLSNKKVIIVASKSIEYMSFNYSARSRGTFLEINVNDSIISLTKDRKATPTEKACDHEKWNKLILLTDNIDLDSISTLKSPTEARFYDGASIATLKIRSKNKVFESSSFDHGNPPKEIEALVKEILSLAENIE